MQQRSTDLESVLQQFVPISSLPLVCKMLREHPHHIEITGPRQSKHGDFSVKPGEPYKITVNGNLNPYAFLITLMHELAHLITHLEHGMWVKPHGKEWKDNFRKTLGPFIAMGVFPGEITPALHDYMVDPDAATGSNLALSLALAKFDRHRNPNVILINALHDYEWFLYGKEKKEYQRIQKRRTRILCREKNSGKEYLFSPLTKVLKKSS
jgi:hypothetical protein